jgi:hypothetical protein
MENCEDEGGAALFGGIDATGGGGLLYAIVEQLSYITSVGRMVDHLQAYNHYSGDPKIARALNKRNDKRHTWIHNAIFERSFEAIKLLHRFGADMNAKCHGTPPIHLLANTRKLPGADLGLDAFQYLVEHSDVSARDDQGASITHVLAEFNMVEELQVLVKFGQTKVVSSLFEARDRLGNKPLHRAAFSGSLETIQFLISRKVDVSAASHSGQSALHCVVDAGMNTNSAACWAALVAAGLKPSTTLDRWGRSAAQYALDHGFKFSLADELMCGEASLKTMILTHPLCRRHPTCAPSQAGTSQGPPENIHRLTVLIDEENGCLRSAELASHVDWVEECQTAAISDVLRVHEWAYLRQLQHTCSKLSPDPEKEGGLTQLDGDTTVGKDTYAAALHAAGSLTQGVDMVMKGQVRNAFCAVRPPGHHAG